MQSSNIPPQGDTIEHESPEAKLADVLAKYQNLVDRCGLRLGTVVSAPENLDVKPSIFGRVVSTHDLLTTHGDKLSGTQKTALIVGIPKVYAAFEQLGFPDLSQLRRKRRQDGGFEMYNPKVGIYFEELSNPGRNFGAKVSLLNDSVATIVQKLQKQIDNAEEISSDVRGEVGSTSRQINTTLS